ncbi:MULTISPECIES: hypothetical protein [unclassified Paenibacillus]|uniref:hypothetical protein n=1 Tax=unclassified Paenibacillus TaxID=185978 RepID=UPI00046392BA|nr:MULTISPECIES: hypothetical protein [unclassified Paenibacillus]KGP82119.1 hypothetical protein P364_0113770 [Paenibacillus sp. MAEPY2]KGP84776.1 hypothetical protein P363_0123060 [Paenibacillus sp. MAEPY1]
MISDKTLIELGVVKDDAGVFLPKDFCLVSLLNWYQTQDSALTDDQHQAITEFLFHLELDLGICDGTNEEYLKQRNVD